MGFSDERGVTVQQVGEQTWKLCSELRYLGNQQDFCVPRDFETDFASVPRPLVWFLPRYGRYTKAAILHDYLWRERAAKGTLPWRDADALFRRAMQELEVPFLRRWIMWVAVRWAALAKPGGREGWHKDLWRVVLVSVAAAPFILPAGAVIVVAMVLFWLFELVTYVPLRLAQNIRRRIGRDATPDMVPPPTFDFKTS